jgi:7,8-dihydropterin-6-yl-methyl-4-(beta-D-ribofuranosyl)aminobenzene 5'-phosphate synthase
MRLIVLSETKSRNGFESEHGLSYYIETDHGKFLFDTGASNIFRNNASKLNIDLDKLDYIVLSHGHFDHGDGLQFIGYNRLICHPECFIKRYRRGGYRNIGLNLTQYEIQKRFDLQLFMKYRKIFFTWVKFPESPISNHKKPRM